MERTDQAINLREADVVVVGGGVSGSLAALRAAETGASVILLEMGGGASGWLQGVNVALGHTDPQDSPDAHERDILKEGYELSDPTIVRQTVHEALTAFAYLDALGMGFARDGPRYRQRHPSGSRFARCCYAPGMMWGGKARQVLSAAGKRAGVVRLRLRAARLVRDGSRIIGLVAVPTKGTGPTTIIAANAVIMASGGAGKLVARSTYPSDIFGSSYAIALHAGAILRDMEFIQFEPLVGLYPEAIRGYVIPTTLFGDGAQMLDAAGVRFLLENRPHGEVGIGKEELVAQMARMGKEGRTTPRGGLWLDCRSVPSETLESYPWLQTFMARHKLALDTSPVEVWPAAHTSLGGIAIDARRQALGVEGLFAVGEAAGGFHGAGRLAGGSGTDVLASGYIGGRTAAETAARTGHVAKRVLLEAAALVADISSDTNAGFPDPALRSLEQKTAQRLEAAAGIHRDDAGLRAALATTREDVTFLWPKDPLAPQSPILGVLDRLLVSDSVLSSALKRTESRGSHIREDYPQLDPGQSAPQGLALAHEDGLLIPVTIS